MIADSVGVIETNTPCTMDYNATGYYTYNTWRADRIQSSQENHMATTRDVKELVAYIKTKFPDGCKGIDCDQCILNDTESGTIEYNLCELLQWLLV